MEVVVLLPVCLNVIEVTIGPGVTLIVECQMSSGHEGAHAHKVNPMMYVHWE